MAKIIACPWYGLLGKQAKGWFVRMHYDLEKCACGPICQMRDGASAEGRTCSSGVP